MIDALRARRNQPGGYWIAKDDPKVATQAVTGSVPVGQLHGAALLSNGASRIVDPYQLAEWPAILELVRTRGPDEILRQIREAETKPAGSLPGFYQADDATDGCLLRTCRTSSALTTDVSSCTSPSLTR